MELLLSFLPTFMLVFCRITSFFVVAPIFSSRVLPLQYKVGFSFFIALLVFLAMDQQNAVGFDDAYVLLVLREVLVGLVIGFVAYLFFSVVQVAGSFMDIQMGFGIANVIDPLTGTQSPMLGNMKFMIASLLFVTMNGHHYMIRGMMDSYKLVPLQNELFSHIASGELSMFILASVSKMFALAFQMAAPIVVTMFLVDVALGILAKTAPQFNLFVVGVPLKIILGLFMLVLLMSGFAYLFRSLFETLFVSMDELLKLIESK
ncbi:flagellar biosynthetic protein FliR [Paenibacillus turpanensis]|uniref:flagellar biosynthetic protein FliR n=1 Tax=Paenibacillus turpanensis TaxID=2689078 RepID=UPI00140C5495|nr:flagellar biosynthetic protein FliR [Paenibacillus turpanensis]